MAHVVVHSLQLVSAEASWPLRFHSEPPDSPGRTRVVLCSAPCCIGSGICDCTHDLLASGTERSSSTHHPDEPFALEPNVINVYPECLQPEPLHLSHPFAIWRSCASACSCTSCPSSSTSFPDSQSPSWHLQPLSPDASSHLQSS